MAPLKSVAALLIAFLSLPCAGSLECLPPYQCEPCVPQFPKTVECSGQDLYAGLAKVIAWPETDNTVVKLQINAIRVSAVAEQHNHFWEAGVKYLFNANAPLISLLLGFAIFRILSTPPLAQNAVQ